MVYIYIVTIRKSRVLDYVSYNELQEKIAGLCLRLPNVNITVQGYEAHGLYRQLHVHLLMCSPTRIQYNKVNLYFKDDGFIYHFRRCLVNDHEDMENICSYISKYDSNEYERDMILAQNYYRYHYAF